MSKLVKIAKQLVRREEGATMIEYGLLAALISIAAITALVQIGPLLLATFNAVVTALTPVA